MPKVLLTEEEVEKCRSFASRMDTSYYAKRNQFDQGKKFKDQVIGKLGEIGVYKLLSKSHSEITYPDFEIYESSKKSWDFDMKSSSFNLHVKSQNMEDLNRNSISNTASWIFQYGDGKKDCDKEIFNKLSPNQYVAFVIVDVYNLIADIKAIVSLDFLHDNNLFSFPNKESLKNTKKAVYYRNLLEFSPEELSRLI